MIYFDTVYILKCHLREHGSAEVLKLAAEANGLASCLLARVEFFSALHLVCAKSVGHEKIYSNDVHLLAAASYFELEGVNIVSPLS